MWLTFFPSELPVTERSFINVLTLDWWLVGWLVGLLAWW